jgi:hypothetical protein
VVFLTPLAGPLHLQDSMATSVLCTHGARALDSLQARDTWWEGGGVWAGDSLTMIPTLLVHRPTASGTMNWAGQHWPLAQSHRQSQAATTHPQGLKSYHNAQPAVALPLLVQTTTWMASGSGRQQSTGTIGGSLALQVAV